MTQRIAEQNCCHGARLYVIKAVDKLMREHKMTVFSASEEKVAEKHLLKGELYFDMPKALRLAGGDVSATPSDFAAHVVVDRELITGQNPASDHALAKALIEALGKSRAPA